MRSHKAGFPVYEEGSGAWFMTEENAGLGRKGRTVLIVRGEGIQPALGI